MCVRIRFRIENVARNELEEIESRSEWVGFVQIGHLIEKEWKFVTLVSDSFDLVSDWIAIIWFNAEFIRIKILKDLRI